MRLFVSILLAASSLSPVIAQDAMPDQPTPNTSSPQTPEPAALPEAPPFITIPDSAKTESSIAGGRALLESMMKAYKAAPTITDTINLAITMSMAPNAVQRQSLTIAMADGDETRIGMDGATITSSKGNIYVEQADSPKKYMVAPVKDGDMIGTLNDIMGGNTAPIPHLQLRHAKTMDDAYAAFTMGALTELALIGADSDTLYFQGKEGAVQADVNTQSNLLSKMKMDFTPPGAPPGIKVNVDFSMDPKISEALESPIAFDPKDRKAVTSLADLEPSSLEVGEMAPDFTLLSLDGKTVKMSELKGSVVVLDFWATWCGPCKKGLPDIQKFHDWAKDSGKSIKVFAVNVWERGDNRDQLVKDFWTGQGFTMPTLIDADDKLIGAYGFRSIPTTVVIDDQGKIFKIHSGLVPGTDIVKELQAETEEAAKH